VLARRLVPVVVALAVLMATGGCGDDSSPDASFGAVSGTAAAGVPAAFDVQARLVGGGTFNLAARAGRPVVLWFWAPS
jgi:hypothetical protein